MSTAAVSLDQRLARLNAAFRSKAPAEQLDLFDRTLAHLSRDGVSDRALREGDVLPPFELPDQLGAPVQGVDLLKAGNLVITFYRGAWCPYCQEELRALQAHTSDLRRLGASLVAISPQTPDNSLNLAQKVMLDYRVLSDRGNHVAGLFGIDYQIPTEWFELMQHLGVDLAAFNGDASARLPIPATYVVDRHGVIRFAFIEPNFTRRCEPATVLEVLRGLA